MMLPLSFLITVALLWGTALATPHPLDQLAKQGKFSLKQIPIRRASPWHGANSIKQAYMKYGVKVPDYIETAVNSNQSPPSQTSVGARPVKGDLEYLINAQVGSHNLSMDLDTGSSDL
jgi:aspergillopepsin I